MLKLNKKIFFTGLTLAALAPVIAQSASLDQKADPKTRMEIEVCDQTGLNQIQITQGYCAKAVNPAEIAAGKPLNASIAPYLDPSSSANQFSVTTSKTVFTAYGPRLTSEPVAVDMSGLATYSKEAIRCAWGHFNEDIAAQDDYKAAIAKFNASACNAEGHTSVPQLELVARINRNTIKPSNPKQLVAFYGKIVGPTGLTIVPDQKSIDPLTGKPLYSDLWGKSDASGKSQSSITLIFDANSVTPADDSSGVAKECSDVSDFLQSDHFQRAVEVSSKALSQEISRMADDCNGRSGGGSGDMSPISDDVVPQNLQQIQGSARSAGSGA